MTTLIVPALVIVCLAQKSARLRAVKEI